MPDIPKRTDVVVIGGGPAGSTAATLLAREGFEVVLLDKAKHPRNTVGESLIPHFWNFTDLVGATEAIANDGFMRKGGGIAFWGQRTRRIKFKDFGFTRPTLHVERDRFDNILLRNSETHGVTVFEETTVTRVDGLEDGPIVHYRDPAGAEGSIQARYVVDGSGQSAVLSRQLGIREFDPNIRFTSLWGYYVGGDYLDVEGERRPFAERFQHPPVTVQSSFGDWGWTWHIVLRDTISVGVILPPERLQAFKAEKDTKEAKFQGIVKTAPIVGDLLQDATYVGPFYGIRDYAYLPVRLAGGRWYLVGDAAAFVDPIASAGVPFGMYAGFLAATSIAASMRREDRADEYRERFCKLYGDRVALFRLIATPSDAPGYVDMVEQAINALGNVGQEEQRLALTQATLTSRSEGIDALLGRLGVRLEPGFRELAFPGR